MATMALPASGCYSYRPLAAVPEPGAVVALDLNDQGRAALADSIGSAVFRIEGALLSTSDSAYQLNVRSVRYFNGGVNEWSGEPLRVPMVFVSQSRERRFDRQRTFLAGAAAAVGLIAAIIGVDLLGGGSPGNERPDPPPMGEQ